MHFSRFSKSTLLTLSLLSSLSFTAHAQSKNEQGSIDVFSGIYTGTCALNIDGTNSTTANAAKKSIDFGTYSVATVTTLAGGAKIGSSFSVLLSLKESGGGAGCAALTTGTWDVAIDLPASAVNTTNLPGNHTLNNTATTNAATGIAASLARAINGGLASAVLVGNKNSNSGNVLAGGIGMSSGDTITLTSSLYKISGATLANGVYTATVPLTVVYR